MPDFRRLLAFACTAAAFTASAQFAPRPTLDRTLPEAAGESVTASNNTAYVANASLDRVAVIAQVPGITYVPVGRTPRFIAMVSRGFVTSNAGDNTVSVQTGPSTSVSVATGGFGPS